MLTNLLDKKFVDRAQQCFAKKNKNRTFKCSQLLEGDEIKSRLPFKTFSTLPRYLFEKEFFQTFFSESYKIASDDAHLFHDVWKQTRQQVCKFWHKINRQSPILQKYVSYHMEFVEAIFFSGFCSKYSNQIINNSVGCECTDMW